MKFSLSRRLMAAAAASALGLSVTACGGGDQASNVEYDDTVTVGILHSLTGTIYESLSGGADAFQVWWELL